MERFNVLIKASRHSILLLRKSFASLAAILESDDWVRFWRRVVTFLFLTHCPVPAVNGHDERWPLFLFWRHHLWPKLGSSILMFCRRKWSFQWYPDQSDRLSEAWSIHQNTWKFDWETQSKIACDYTWLLHGKICPSQWRFLRISWIGGQLLSDITAESAVMLV